MANIKDKNQTKFLDIKARLFKNKSNGQISITLPKKELKKFVDMDTKENIYPVKMPKKIPIRIFSWEDRS
jgi:hypothetical protein